MRKNEAPGCSCPMCRRGIRSRSGHFTTKQVIKRIRRKYKQALRWGDDVMQVIVSTPYTD